MTLENVIDKSVDKSLMRHAGRRVKRRLDLENVRYSSFVLYELAIPEYLRLREQYEARRE